MPKPRGSKNKSPYPIHRHRNFYWGIVSPAFKSELAAFKRMHDRVHVGKVPTIQWRRTLEGFLAFFKAIGPIPKKLKKPSVGRLRHEFGYRAGNVIWEEHSINSIKRKGTCYES